MNTYYMAWASDPEIVEKSSSGGIFSLLAEYVISKGGMVIGAAMKQEDRTLEHIGIEKVSDIEKIRGSKYYQSSALNGYLLARAALESGREVLFSGTACQVAAVKKFCRGMDEHLLTVDVLCHGVANKRIVDEYVKSQERKYKKKLAETYFRTKKAAWKNGGGTSMELHFADGDIRVVSRKIDPFFMGFNLDLFLRESCYDCRFVGTERISDFTLADFWGVPEQLVEAECLIKGISLVVVNNEKGARIWRILEEKKAVICREAEEEIAIANNSAFHTRRKMHHNHDYFFKYLGQKDFNILVHRCLWKEYARFTIKRIIGEKRAERIMNRLRGSDR